MKKQLNEQLGRIKDMMKKINENEFDSSMEKPSKQDEVDRLVKMAIDNFDYRLLNPELTNRGVIYMYKDSVKMPVKIDDDTYFNILFEIEWDTRGYPLIKDLMGKCIDIYVEMHDASDNMKEMQNWINHEEGPSMEVLEPFYNELTEWANEYNDEVADARRNGYRFD